MSLYFIAVAPNNELSEKVRVFQKDFAERFNSVKSYNNFPHITIIPPFNFEENNERFLVEKFEKLNLETETFDLILNGFKSFPNKNNPVIFINPEQNPSFKSLFEEVNLKMNFNIFGKFHPHLTVAYRDLSFENHEKAWKEYKNKDFSEIFKVEKVGLYKHFNKKWNLISEIPLNKKS